MMNTAGVQSNIGAEIGIEKSARWKIWVFFLLLAFLLHLLVFLIHVQWSPGTLSPPPVEVNQVDPSKLEAIRKQWKDKGLLLDQDKSKPSEKEAPPDARYMSDRNIRVEKEQKSANTNVVPKPGRPDGAEEAPQEQQQRTRAKPKGTTKKFPKLGNLGVPIQLDSEPKPDSDLAQNDVKDIHSAPLRGGQQYIEDKEVPVGGENLLNAQESVFYSFYARIYEAIGPIWQSHLRQAPVQNRITAGQYTTSVDVVFDENGNLQTIRKLQSSGIPEFDDAVDKSWKKVQRFPNPPKGLLDRERQVHTGWSFTVHVGDGIQFLPPERRY